MMRSGDYILGFFYFKRIIFVSFLSFFWFFFVNFFILIYYQFIQSIVIDGFFLRQGWQVFFILVYIMMKSMILVEVELCYMFCNLYSCFFIQNYFLFYNFFVILLYIYKEREDFEELNSF